MRKKRGKRVCEREREGQRKKIRRGEEERDTESEREKDR